MTPVATKHEVETARWKATVYYRSENGLLDIEHGIEEIDELHDIVERGPDWNTIEQIVITLDRKSNADMTIEEARHA